MPKGRKPTVKELHSQMENMAQMIGGNFMAIAQDMDRMNTILLATLDHLGLLRRITCPECQCMVNQPVLSTLEVDYACPNPECDCEDITVGQLGNQQTIEDWDNGTDIGDDEE